MPKEQVDQGGTRRLANLDTGHQYLLLSGLLLESRGVTVDRKGHFGHCRTEQANIMQMDEVGTRAGEPIIKYPNTYKWVHTRPQARQSRS